ncbi:MAG: NAD(P)-binding protein, partial [Hyphomicrobiales bacterium]|nr:NAD(P)-binding protein [Hyphomicrobiales bacterium]
MVKTVVIGAGAMGLAAAHYALNLGHEVDIVEADAQAGGMAAHFDFDGLSLERFYHFVCKADAATFSLMNELGIGDKMRWRGTSMAYWIDGKLHRWGDPLALLAFPKLGLAAKLRYGLHMFMATQRSDAAALEHLSAREWIVKR